MMNGYSGWGMGWGSGGFMGIGLLVVAAVVVIAVFAMRRRNR
jgi:hypothetical protein